MPTNIYPSGVFSPLPEFRRRVKRGGTSKLANVVRGLLHQALRPSFWHQSYLKTPTPILQYQSELRMFILILQLAVMLERSTPYQPWIRGKGQPRGHLNSLAPKKTSCCWPESMMVALFNVSITKEYKSVSNNPCIVIGICLLKNG